jgi:hypothetical protein
MSNLIITLGSEGSELSAAYMEQRILAQWEPLSWRPVVCKSFSYVDVKIREIGPRTVLAARLAEQRRQLSPQMMGRIPTLFWQVSRARVKGRYVFLYVVGVKISKKGW